MQYTLSQLLGEDLTLVIPAIQRDYCWGGDPDKVTPFIRGIMHLYITDRDATLGLLYGYETPPGSRHVHIIDGQQRLTTLYLLVGMLYRRTPTPQLRRMLISDYQLIDEREPRLLYQVRTEAMYFMSDLVTNFFLNRDGRLSQLERSPWYYRSYDADPTVLSFIGAIRRIDAVLEQADLDPEWDFGAFAWFVTTRLTFRYYDLGGRAAAEQMFITVNTTGEPLTRPQVLRARLFSTEGVRPDWLRRWDRIETWCWLHRPEGEVTSDPSLDTYIGLYQTIRGHEPQVEALDDFYRLFDTYRRVVEACGVPTVCDVASPQLQYTLLPVMAYAEKFPSASDSSIRDFHTFLSNQLLYRRPASNGADTKALLAMVAAMKSEGPESLAALPHRDAYARVFGEEERAQIQVLQYGGVAQLRRAQAHPLLGGKVLRVVQWCRGDDPDGFPARFSAYVDAIYHVFGDDIDCRPELDNVRRALLAIRHPGYPVARLGDTLLTLCWHVYDWQRLLQQVPGAIRQLLDRVMSSSQPLEVVLEQIAAGSGRDNPYRFLLRTPSLLGMSQRRLLYRPCQPFIGVRSAADGDYRWYVDQSPLKLDTTRWTPIMLLGSRTLRTHHRRLAIAVELLWVPSAKKTPACFKIRVVSVPQDTDSAKVKVDMSLLSASLPAAFTAVNADSCQATARDGSSALIAIHTVLKTL